MVVVRWQVVRQADMMQWLLSFNAEDSCMTMPGRSRAK